MCFFDVFFHFVFFNEKRTSKSTRFAAHFIEVERKEEVGRAVEFCGMLAF